MSLRLSRLKHQPFKMKKKREQKSTSESDIDLKSVIQQHSLFFDKLVDLIPARFYLSVEDDDKPWFQGLSKAAQASAKKETRQNIKKARRERLDPEKSVTTLDLLKKKETEIENPLPPKEDDRSVTVEELQQRYRRRMEELRQNRPDKGDMERKRGSQLGKRKQNPKSEEMKAKAKTGSSLGSSLKVEDVAFNQVKIGNEDGNQRKRRKLSKSQTLEMAKKLEEQKKDPEKGEVFSKKHSWKAAVSRAAGVKVHDDPKLLRRSIKKEKKMHQKNTKKWKDRVDSREKTRSEKQKTRSDNISERIQQKKMRRIAKREKKLMRPGFEGRKAGFINGS